MSDIISESDPFSPEEQAYFDNRGAETEKPLSASPEAETPEPQLDSGETDEAAPEAPEVKDEPSKPKTVPHAALHEERARRKDAEEKFREAELRFARAEERMKAMLERFQAPEAPAAQPQTDGIPDPETDPIAAIKYATEQARQLAEDRARTKAEREQADETQRFVAKYQQDAQSYVEKAPDFFDAYNHLKADRLKELVVMGLSDAQARAQLVNEEFQVAQLAYQKGRNPAEVLYEAAKLRGYAKAAAKQAATEPSVEDRLAAVEAGQNANKSLSATGGKSGGAEVSANDILSMSDAEFDRWAAKHPRQARKFLGGA